MTKPAGTQIISDRDIWPVISSDKQRHTEILDWLRANGIDPNDVSADSTVTIEPTTDGHLIRYTALLRNAAGHHYVDPNDPDERPAREERTAPLAVLLPDTWPQPVLRAPDGQHE